MSKNFALIENICFHFFTMHFYALLIGDSEVELIISIEEWEPSVRSAEQDPCYSNHLERVIG